MCPSNGSILLLNIQYDTQAIIQLLQHVALVKNTDSYRNEVAAGQCIISHVVHLW